MNVLIYLSSKKQYNVNMPYKGPTNVGDVEYTSNLYGDFLNTIFYINIMYK